MASRPSCASVDGDTAQLELIHDYRSSKHSVWGITARNREQNFALNLLLDPEIDLVTILGPAGTGKTLLTLAAGLMQTLDTSQFAEIIMTRVTIPLGEDIGFLPGTEEEKMEPWMGALVDNLEVLTQSAEGGNWGRAATNDLLRNRIKIRSLNFMRGRTFMNRYVIIDEAQNLTPKQMKALLTRAGPGTKMVCLGNIAQIDTPYLTETTSGLTYVVNRFRGWPHAGHITLKRGERSRLADQASEYCDAEPLAAGRGLIPSHCEVRLRHRPLPAVCCCRLLATWPLACGRAGRQSGRRAAGPATGAVLPARPRQQRQHRHQPGRRIPDRPHDDARPAPGKRCYSTIRKHPTTCSRSGLAHRRRSPGRRAAASLSSCVRDHIHQRLCAARRLHRHEHRPDPAHQQRIRTGRRGGARNRPCGAAAHRARRRGAETQQPHRAWRDCWAPC